MAVEGKKQLNVSVSDQTVALVTKAAYLLHRTKSQIVEDAVTEFAAKNGIGERYQLNIKNGMLVLLKVEGDSVGIVEMEALNGVAPEVIAQRYSSRFHQDVPLIVDEKK